MIMRKLFGYILYGLMIAPVMPPVLLMLTVGGTLELINRLLKALRIPDLLEVWVAWSRRVCSRFIEDKEVGE